MDFSGQPTVNEHCPRCLGTGIDGGYFPGIELGIIKDSITIQESPSELGYLHGETIQGRCIAYPWISRGDVWCEENTNKRYVIAAATPASSYKTTHLIYTLQMHQVEFNDVLHTKLADEYVVNTGEYESKEASTMPKNSGWDDVLSEL